MLIKRKIIKHVYGEKTEGLSIKMCSKHYTPLLYIGFTI